MRKALSRILASAVSSHAGRSRLGPPQVLRSAALRSCSLLGFRSEAVADNVEPLSLVANHLAQIAGRLRLSAEIPLQLAATAQQVFKLGFEGKTLRPMVLLLMSSSLSMDSPDWRGESMVGISEMIHAASLLHNGLPDGSSGTAGSSMALPLMAGNLLLVTATETLSRLMNHEVTALMSEVIVHLESGEAMQVDAQHCSMDYYLSRTFYKTASLIANSCKCIAVLAGHSKEVATVAFDYGRHLGMAYQIVDDLLDFTGTRASLGKPVLSDLREGLATAPVLLALDEHRELQPLIERKFKHPGDVEAALAMVLDSNGIARTKELAREHARKAAAAIAAFPPTSLERAKLSRRALTKLAEQALDGQK